MDAETLAKQLEMEAMADMFTKMTDSCHNKCISKFYDRKIIIVILLSNRKMLSNRYKISDNLYLGCIQRIFMFDFCSFAARVFIAQVGPIGTHHLLTIFGEGLFFSKSKL